MAAEALALMAVLAVWCPCVRSGALTSACQFGQSAMDGCEYMCHCEYQVTCDSMDGSCGFGGCAPAYHSGHDYTPSWMEPGCQIGDALHEKSATSGPEVVMDPNLALNGNRDPSGSCAISRSQDGSAAWWQVDMGDMFLVMSVTVTSSDDPAYLSNSRVEVSLNTDVGSLQLCGTINFIRNAGDDLIECEPHRQGRFMRITRLDSGVHTGELRLCQAYMRAFLIRDCEPCHYGAGCLSECNCNGNACDAVTGECLSVSCSEVVLTPTTAPTNTANSTIYVPAPGSDGNTATNPDSGTSNCEPCHYGAGCLSECNCNGNACDAVTGACLSVSCSEVVLMPTTVPTTTANSIISVPAPRSGGNTTTTTPDSGTSSSSASSPVRPGPTGDTSRGAIYGIVAVAVLLAIAIAVFCWWWLWKRDHKVTSRPGPDYEGLVTPGCQNSAPNGNARYAQERSPSNIQLYPKKESDYESIGAAVGNKIPEGVHCNDEGPQNSSGRSVFQFPDYDYSHPGIYTIEGRVAYTKKANCDVDRDSGYGNSGLAGRRPSMGDEQDNHSVYCDESMADYSDGYSADYWLGDDPPPLPPPNKAMAVPLPPPE